MLAGLMVVSVGGGGSVGEGSRVVRQRLSCMRACAQNVAPRVTLSFGGGRRVIRLKSRDGRLLSGALRPRKPAPVRPAHRCWRPSEPRRRRGLGAIPGRVAGPRVAAGVWCGAMLVRTMPSARWGARRGGLFGWLFRQSRPSRAESRLCWQSRWGWGRAFCGSPEVVQTICGLVLARPSGDKVGLLFLNPMRLLLLALVAALATVARAVDHVALAMRADEAGEFELAIQHFEAHVRATGDRGPRENVASVAAGRMAAWGREALGCCGCQGPGDAVRRMSGSRRGGCISPTMAPYFSGCIDYEPLH